ncbi:MAG: NAD(P)/FAD-dependent oxidoreductase [Planctomycetota bacterium]|nr:NAD(P)/FAD-dependent oxidoreductase [Planctomycetota bacterium]
MTDSLQPDQNAARSDKGIDTWRLTDLEQALDEPESALRERAAHRLGFEPEQLRGFRIAKRSVDARRRRTDLRFVCQVDVMVDQGLQPPRLTRLLKKGTVRETPVHGSLDLSVVDERRRGARAVVVGAGPAGLMAALVLARNGVEVDLLDRGQRVEERSKSLAGFHRRGDLDQDSNLLFGEGGAGTYSDGKLYTRVNSPLEVPILEELVACGAQPDILYDSRAHIGTDRLHTVLPRLRARLQDAGVRFHYGVRMESLIVESGPPQRARAVQTQEGELPCDGLFLALGHSARDTWQTLHEQGVAFEQKPFQFGVRVEHPQELVTSGRYGGGDPAGLLGPASYALQCRAGEGLPGVHSFCMCPGGKIVASVNEPGYLCTNGMSNSSHSSPFANAALVTTVLPEEFAAHGTGPFAGVDYQRYYEERFFEAGGSTYAAPSQRVPDFLAGRSSSGELKTSYTFGAVPGRLDELLPPGSRDALRRGLARFDQMLPGFGGSDGILVGIESRSSGPVRCPREAGSRAAVGWEDLFPLGEGAGYAGGIMSAALDGALSAQVWLRGAVAPASR